MAALQFSTPVRNAMLDAIEAAIGASGVLKFRTGAQPASCATADSGSELASMSLPADYMSPAALATKVKSGTWQVVGSAAGTPGHFRLYASDGTTCHMQGDVTITGGGGKMTVSSMSFVIGKVVSVTGFTLSVGNG